MESRVLASDRFAIETPVTKVKVIIGKTGLEAGLKDFVVSFSAWDKEGALVRQSSGDFSWSSKLDSEFFYGGGSEATIETTWLGTRPVKHVEIKILTWKKSLPLAKYFQGIAISTDPFENSFRVRTYSRGEALE